MKYWGPYRWLLAFVAAGSIAELLLFLFESRTVVIFNGYMLAEFALISMFLYSSFLSARNRMLVILAMAIFAIAIGFFSDLNGFKTRINSIGLISECLLIFGLAILLFFEVVNRPDFHFIKTPEIWFVMGLVFYFGGNFFTFENTAEFMRRNGRFPFDIWEMHSILNILFNICIASSLFFAGRRPPDTGS